MKDASSAPSVGRLVRKLVGINIYLKAALIFLIYSLLNLLIYITGYLQDALKLELFGAVMLSAFILVYFLAERYTHLRNDERRDLSITVGFVTGYSLSVYYGEKTSYILLLWAIGFAQHFIYLRIKNSEEFLENLRLCLDVLMLSAISFQ